MKEDKAVSYASAEAVSGGPVLYELMINKWGRNWNMFKPCGGTTLIIQKLYMF